MNLAQLLARSARTFPHAPAIFHGDALVCDYRELARRAASIGGYLRTVCGLEPGDRVALFMSNCPQYLEVMYGAWHAGLAVVPINAKLHAREVEFILEDAGVGALFVTDKLADGLAPIQASAAPYPIFIAGDDAYTALLAHEPMPEIHPRGPDDLAWLFYTSGTTGRPKGVMLSHRNLLAMTMCYFTDVDPLTQRDAIVYAAPMSHGAGLYNLPCVLAAARHVVPLSGGFEPAELASLAAHHRDLSMFAAPTMVKRLVAHMAATGADAWGFKTIVYGGGPMYTEDIRHAIDVMGECFVQIYGQGESPMTITALSRTHLGERAHPRHAERIASVGIAHSMVEVRVADEAGKVLACGALGEVQVRGDAVMLGYWKNDAATAGALREGWLSTGDIGYLDEDGFLTLRDRSKDVIISGGSNIYPREVEEVLLMAPGVLEVSVIGVPHPDWGEEVVAFIVPVPGAAPTEAQLDTLCLQHIARFKRPKHYRFVAALPKNNYGKVLKTALREAIKQETGLSNHTDVTRS